MAWTYLLVASLFEIIFAVGLKYTDGFSRFLPSVIAGGSGIASFLILSQALKTLPIGTAYAAWTGIGAVGATILGILLFKEPHNLARIICTGFIIVGIIGLRLTTSH